MPKIDYIYAKCYGEVIRFTPHKWRAMLVKAAKGESVNYYDYGKSICIISHNITDLDAEFAEDLLQSQR